MDSKYIKKAPVEKRHWQKKFIDAQEEILSAYAIDAYKSKGKGVLVINCSDLMECIVPGLSFPDEIRYFKEEVVKEILDISEIFAYNPEETYFVVFRRYTDPREVRIWGRELKIGDEETWSKKFELLYSLTETNAQNQEMCPDPKELH